MNTIQRTYFPDNFNYTAYQVGTSPNGCTVEIDVHLGNLGIALAKCLMILAEIENERLAKLFGWPPMKTTASVMRAHGPGGVHLGWDETIYLFQPPFTDPHQMGVMAHQITSLWICEIVELYAHADGKNWDAGTSHGEALSRLIGNCFMPHGLDNVGIQSVGAWLNTPGRPDWVSKFNASETDTVPIGCSVAFLHFLHERCRLPFEKIVKADGATLEDKFQQLCPGHKGGYAAMMEVLDKRFPRERQVPNTMAMDSPFTVKIGPTGPVAG